jgi:hypothetical protein
LPDSLADIAGEHEESSATCPHLFPPPRRGGGLRKGVERSEAVERLERFELQIPKP